VLIETKEMEQGSAAKVDDLSLPKTTVNSCIKSALPANMKVTAETQELVMKCTIEFIHLLAAEANDICIKKGKKTLTGDHILDALQQLGFGDYSEEVSKALAQHKTIASARPKSKNKLRDSGLSTEELAAQQQLLFDKAKSVMAAKRGEASGMQNNG